MSLLYLFLGEVYILTALVASLVTTAILILMIICLKIIHEKFKSATSAEPYNIYDEVSEQTELQPHTLVVELAYDYVYANRDVRNAQEGVAGNQLTNNHPTDVSRLYVNMEPGVAASSPSPYESTITDDIGDYEPVYDHINSNHQ